MFIFTRPRCGHWKYHREIWRARDREIEAGGTEAGAKEAGAKEAGAKEAGAKEAVGEEVSRKRI